MFSTLVVPLDGFPLAERSLPAATTLAEAAGGRLLLVRIETGLVVAEGQEAPPPAQEALEQVASRLRAQGLEAACVVELVDRAGEVAERICAIARERGADLIAMSTHGRGGLGRW